MPLQYTQQEIERELSDILVYSDRVEISRATGISETIIKEMLNPDAERKSYFYCALRVACALYDINEARGDRMVGVLNHFYEMSKRRKTQPVSVDLATAEFAREAGDVPAARLEHKPLKDQLREVRESIAQAKRLEHALVAEMQDVRDILPADIKAEANGRANGNGGRR